MKNINSYYCFIIALSCFSGVNSDRDEEKIEEAFDHIKAQQNGEPIVSRSEGGDQGQGYSDGSGPYFPHKRLPTGNIFRDNDANPLTCGATYDLSFARTIYWKMASKSRTCYHAFIGSRATKCRATILCEDWINFEKPSGPRAGCDRESLQIIDGTIGLMFGCGRFRFNGIPRHSRNNGTDLYVYFKGSSSTACVTFCLEDLTSDHDVKTPRPITKHKTFQGFQLEPSCKCGKRRDIGRVVGGEDAIKFEFPWLVAIVWKGVHGYDRIPFCGGSLINDRYVVTAAHCFMVDGVHPWEIQLILHAHVMDPKIKRGTYREDSRYSNIPGWDLALETDESEQSIRVDVEEIKCHPHFSQDTFDWDVCVLKLKQRVNLRNKKVAPICLPRISEMLNYTVDSLHTVAGWGRPKEDAPALSRTAQKLDLPFVDFKKCEHYTMPAKRHMCAGYPSGKGDACAGDSGGPLIWKFRPDENQYVLTGIVSAGEGCARRGRVGVYTDTMEITQWVYHQTADGIWCER